MKRIAPLVLFALVSAAACHDDVPTRVTAPATTEARPLSGPPARAFHPVPGGYAVTGTRYRAQIDASTRALRVTLPSGAPIELATTSIARGALELAMTKETTRAAHGVVEIPRGAAVESIEPTRDTLEQRWTFASRPDGSGDLVVRVHADATPRRTPRGAAVGSVAYRDAAWVDARGVRTDLAVDVDGQDLVLRVPARVVEASAYPAVLDPTIGPELAVDAPITGAHDRGTWGPRLGTGKGGNLLLTYNDYRLESPFGNSMFAGEQMFGVRVSTAGASLDPTGFAVAAERDFYVEDWAIAYDGVANWFVTWLQTGINAPCNELWGAVVDDQGKILSARSAQGACSSRSLSVGFDGTSFVVLLGGTYTQELYVTRFSQAGVPLELLPKLVATGVVQYAVPGLACRTGGCFATWSTGSAVRGSRLSSSLVAQDAPALSVLAGNLAIAGVAYDGQSWVVGAGTQLARVDAATGVVASPVTVAGTIESVVSDGTGTWAGWTTAGNQVQLTRIDRAGAPLAGAPFTVTTAAKVSSGSVALGFGGGLGYVGWEDTRTHASGDVYYARFSAAGAALDGDGKAANVAANGERYPAIAASTTNYLAAWSDTRANDGAAALYAARLSSAGAPLDAPATLLGPSASSRPPSVAAASDGTDYLVVWNTGTWSTTHVNAVRVSGTTGAVLGGAVDFGTGQSPSVTWDGTQYVVAFHDGNNVNVRLVSAAGVPTASLVADASAPDLFEGSATGVAWSGTSTLVVYNVNGAIRGRRLGANGQFLDAAPFTISPGPQPEYFPRVTWDGLQWVVVWEDYRVGHIIDSDIYAARVSPAGAVLTPAEIAVGTGPSSQLFPAVIGMGDGYSDLVVWSDNANPARVMDYDLYGVWLRRSDGAILDKAPVTIAGSVGNELGAVFAPAGAARALVAYQLNDDSAGVGNTRIRARFVGSGAAAAATCTKDDDCVTRACSDGVCCDRACKGSCETCSATPGTCTAVKGAEDPDTCSGENVCSATGTCQRKLGSGCATDADCASGVCAAGVCCDRRCDSPCEVCAAGVGTCALRGARSAGAPTCAPYACNGAEATCPTSCTSDAACPAGSRCEASSGVCVSGGACIDDRTALLADESTVSCAPYTCASGACRTTCRSVADCVYPAICDENATCSLPPGPVTASGGCAASPRPSGEWRFFAALLALAAIRRRASRGTKAAAARAARPST